jgi:hypothetical protein
MRIILDAPWNDKNNTNANATDVTHERVKEAWVIRAKQAFHRDATIRDACFEIAPQQVDLPPRQKLDNGEEVEVKVLCGWFGRIPPSQHYITITVREGFTTSVEQNVLVVRDIALPE